MSRDYLGDLKWRPGLIVNNTGPLMHEVQVARVDISTYRPVEANGSWAHSWGHWHRHCWGQPTQSGQHTTSANPTEYSIQCGWYSSRDSRGRSTGDGSCSHTCSSRPSWSDSSQFYGPWAVVPSESAQGTTEILSLKCFSTFLRNCRKKYKLGPDHFCVEEILRSPSAFTININYMREHRFN